MTETPDTTENACESVEFACADGVRLLGHFLKTSSGTPGLPVLLSPATGVRQHFYLRFAAWLSGQGHDVLVFDYRGVGLSLHGRLRDCTATLEDWGRQDQVAALDWLVQRTGSEQVLLLGHSAGGQMMGLLPNHHRIARVVGVAASTGWFAGMRLGYRIAAWAVMRGIIPAGIALKGYAPCSLVGLGENLPATVGLQWGQWCAAGGYATNATQKSPQHDFHTRVRAPITVLHASDDNIASAISTGSAARTRCCGPCWHRRFARLRDTVFQ